MTAPVGIAAGKKILIVEDEESISDSVAAIVRTIGGEPIQVGNGEEAYEVFLNAQPDLCLVDILLPGLNGLELTRRIKMKTSGKVPVVLVSAVYREPEDIEYNCRSCGADDYLPKPFAPEDLIATIAKYVGGDAQRSSARKEGDGPAVTEIDVPLEGSLKSVEFASILLKLFLGRATGTLSIHTGNIRREIYLIEGKPVFARANTLAESLGTLLIRKGLADLQQINEILKSRSGNRTMGQQLIEAGVISTEDLIATLSEQVRERIMTCFGIREGQYNFVEGTDFVDHVQVYKQNPIALIRHGIERNLQVNQLAEKLQNAVDKYVVRSANFDFLAGYFPIGDADEKFVAQLDGSRTLTQVLQTQLLDVTKALQLVWSMHLAGLVDFASAPDVGRPGPNIRVPSGSGPDLRVPPERDPGRSSRPKRSDIAPDELRRLVIDKYLMLGKANSYQLLGIGRNAGLEEIEQAATELLHTFSWETTEVLSAEDRVKANDVYAAIVVARRTLADPKGRTTYDESLSRVDSMVGVTSEYRLNRGALAYGAAKRLIEANKLESALEHLKTAAQHNPDDPNVVADLAWVEYKLDGSKAQAEAALAKLNSVLASEPRNTRILFYLGVLESDAGNVETSREHLRNVLSKNPDHAEAKRLLAELSPPEVENFDDAGSTWSKLFGDS